MFSKTTLKTDQHTEIVTNVNSVAEFLDRYYKPARYRGRDADMPGYSDILLKSHQAMFDKYGYDLISRHDSVTGKSVWLFR